MGSRVQTRNPETPAGLALFEKEANFVSLFLVGKKYDDFVFAKATATTQPNLLSAKQIHIDLFDKRNRVMHWGEVDYGREDAQTALAAAKQAIGTLRSMDFEKWQAQENEHRASREVARLPNLRISGPQIP